MTPKEAFASSAVRSTDPSKDWTYVAEGALNVTVKYQGDIDILEGRVLRIRKKNPHASGEDSGDVNLDPWAEGLQFVENVMLPFLDIGTCNHLPSVRWG